MQEDKLCVDRISLVLVENDKPLTILSNVSLSAKAGRIHALIGPSGSGKSTLLYTLNRLQEITNGRITLEGMDIRSIDVLALRRRIGLVMQKAIFFPGTIGENILFGPTLRSKFEPSFQNESFPDPRYYLQLVGLEPDWVNRNPNTLSGGQQQRVSLARTLANKPEILLLDEPTAALDTQASLLLEDLIMQLCNNHQLTVIWVTHNLHQAKRIAHDITLLYEGRVVEQGETASFFSHPKTEKGKSYLAEYLGVGK